jgi:hypothetical protein
MADEGKVMVVLRSTSRRMTIKSQCREHVVAVRVVMSRKEGQRQNGIVSEEWLASVIVLRGSGWYCLWYRCCWWK